jgi:hypothetical protein
LKQKKFTRDIAIALLLAGLFLLILALVSLDSTDSLLLSGSDSSATGTTSSKPLELINKHLREVYDRQEIEKKNAENLNVITAPPIYKSPKDEPVYNFDNLPISFDQDSINELVGKDLGHFVHSNSSDRSLSEQIQDEVIDDISRKAQQEAEKKSLAEAIINKAREKGLHVEIDDDFKIKSVKRIIKKESPSIFDPNAVPNR